MLGAFDVAVFRFINGVLANPIFDILMPILTLLGSGDIVFIIAMSLLMLAKGDKKMAGIFLLAGLTVSYFAAETLKAAVATPRPFMSLPDVRLMVPEMGGFSFPSGHTVIAFMSATIMTRFFKKCPIWFLLATLVAFSRVYVGAHYLSDVIAGAIIGIVVGYSLLIMAGNHRSCGMEK